MEKEKKRPSQRDKNEDIKKLGTWVNYQKHNYKNNKKSTSTKNPEIRKEWEDVLKKYFKYLKQDIISLQEDENEQKTKPVKKQRDIPNIEYKQEKSDKTPKTRKISDIGKLHKTYLKMGSDNLHQTFEKDPQLWLDYHSIRKETFSTYEHDSIPTNRIIKELEKIRTTRVKAVVDMGCGQAQIAHYFSKKKDKRFSFHNYDHQSGGDEIIQKVDISLLPLEDSSAEITIMSMSLWGTLKNRTEYIKEAYRVLESGGKFYIIDSTKKWSPEPITKENGGEVLRNLIKKNGFNIIQEDIGIPFCFFICNKIY